MKVLYLLALFQLVAGPLVIFQVSVLCRMTVRETPSVGIGPAFTKALHLSGKQAMENDPALLPSKAAPGDRKVPAPEPKGKLPDGKIAALPWNSGVTLADPAPTLAAVAERIRMRTPLWPQAPPAPPPRVG